MALYYSYLKRTNEFYDYRPPVKFGVEWNYDPTNPYRADPVRSLTRLGDAATMVVDTTPLKHAGKTEAEDYPVDDEYHTHHISDFNEYLPWKGMRRYAMNHNGDIIYDVEKDAYAAPADKEIYRTELPFMIVVRCPYYFYKVENPAQYVWRYWISPYPFKDFRIHPAFLRASDYTAGEILPTEQHVTDVFVGAYEAITAPSAGSTAGSTPKTNLSRGEFRDFIEKWGPNPGATRNRIFQMIDFKTWSSLQLEYLVEYACLNSQSPSGSTARGGLSPGINSGTIKMTGYTSTDSNLPSSRNLGNLSGQVLIAGTSPPVYAMSYHGIENLWGNTWTVVDGAKYISIGGYKYLYTCTTNAYTDTNSSSLPYEIVDNRVPTVSAPGYAWLSYPTNIIDGENDWSFANWETTSTPPLGDTFACDSFWNLCDKVPFAGAYPMVGGSYGNGAKEPGIFCFAINDMTDYGVDIGTRIQNIPWDIAYWRY